jgi:hypothetical protein
MTTTIEAPTEFQAIAQPVVIATDKPNWLRHARNSCLRVPPLWPLQSFVAVNPFVGLTGKTFSEVCGLMQRVTHESMLMSVDYFRQQVARGRITTQDLTTAIQRRGAELTSTDLLTWLEKPEHQPMGGVKSFADVATARFGGRWSLLITEEISKWCAA